MAVKVIGSHVTDHKFKSLTQRLRNMLDMCICITKFKKEGEWIIYKEQKFISYSPGDWE